MIARVTATRATPRLTVSRDARFQFHVASDWTRRRPTRGHMAEAELLDVPCTLKVAPIPKNAPADDVDDFGDIDFDEFAMAESAVPQAPIPKNALADDLEDFGDINFDEYAESKALPVLKNAPADDLDDFGDIDFDEYTKTADNLPVSSSVTEDEVGKSKKKRNKKKAKKAERNSGEGELEDEGDGDGAPKMVANAHERFTAALESLRGDGNGEAWLSLARCGLGDKKLRKMVELLGANPHGSRSFDLSKPRLPASPPLNARLCAKPGCSRARDPAVRMGSDARRAVAFSRAAR